MLTKLKFPTLRSMLAASGVGLINKLKEATTPGREAPALAELETIEECVRIKESADTCLELALAAAAESSNVRVTAINEIDGVIHLTNNAKGSMRVRIVPGHNSERQVVIYSTKKAEDSAKAIKSQLEKISSLS